MTMDQYNNKTLVPFDTVVGFLFSVFIKGLEDIDNLEMLFILRGVGMAAFEGSEEEYDLFCRSVACSESIFTELWWGKN